MYSYNVIAIINVLHHFVARPVCTISGTPTRAQMVSFLDSSGPSLRSGQDFRHYRKTAMPQHAEVQTNASAAVLHRYATGNT